ncbi:hypothetical protein P280DRAFT_454656 [Massarina eburnea CBS 473.64]|uniref:Uncharacterized protein n=1 Tax=Massarina eburnea CBS 473.64 TaxID=1395130 RepID=A0A6A6RW19_9PLEO|nr:hypothetical protein P280DRAFT_454656 [Massarina eburnea CBS 473.64]
MSTTYLSIYDLLRITYTYESQAAMEAYESVQKPDPLSRSDCCMQTPELCLNASRPTPSATKYAALETDFTDLYAQKKRDSCVSMT